nr:62 kDa protein [wheat closterovirus 1]
MPQPIFPNYTWGSLFRRFYGARKCTEYLSNALASYPGYSGGDYQFSDGSMFTARDLSESRPGTAAREFAVLVYSDRIYDWIKLNNTSLKYAYYKLNQPAEYTEGDSIDADPKSVGCKFSTETIKSLLVAAGRTNPPNSLVEHCWSLSNSCGDFIDPSDISRFKKITFGEPPDHDEDEVNVGTRVGNYLAHCINLFDKSLTESNKGRTTMLESFAVKIREYYASSDLLYNKPTDNILLTGVIYDFLVHNNVSLSTYKADVDNFTVFLNSYAPLVAEIWDFKWNSPPPDIKLLFEFTAQDLHVSLPYYNINDAKIVIGNTLRFVESVVQAGPLSGLKSRVSAVLSKDNPSASEEDLWAAFHCYYGIYRTGQTRKVPRPLRFTTPLQLGARKFDFSGVESLFDKLQKDLPDINVRRQFCGSLADEAFEVFRNHGIALPRISTLNIPVQYGYLNVDYYKHVPAQKLSSEERVILANINKNVDEICVNRNISTHKTKTDAKVTRFPTGKGNAQRYRYVIEESPLKKLTKALWHGVRSSNGPQERPKQFPSGFKLV